MVATAREAQDAAQEALSSDSPERVDSKPQERRKSAAKRLVELMADKADEALKIPQALWVGLVVIAISGIGGYVNLAHQLDSKVLLLDAEQKTLRRESERRFEEQQRDADRRRATLQALNSKLEVMTSRIDQLIGMVQAQQGAASKEKK